MEKQGDVAARDATQTETQRATVTVEQEGGTKQEVPTTPTASKDSGTRENNNATRNGPEGVALPMSLIKALRGKSSGENGSNSSNGGGSGNNSDNSALVSLGNTSFGFNFDSEEAMINGSPPNSEGGDSDGNGNNGPAFQANLLKQAASQVQAQAQAVSTPKPPSAPTAGEASASILPSSVSSSHSAAAAAAVANLQTIAVEYSKKDNNDLETKPAPKRKSEENVDNDSGGYNTDDESRGDHLNTAKRPPSPGPDESVSNGSDKKGARKKKKLDDFKREERNAREKERSFRISRQINELRNLLSSGGVIVPKGTKSSVLTEAANYIRMLQQHQYRSEIDRHQLVQQIQMIGGGALGQPAATAVRHVAAQNGVWSLGNFGGVPPKSAMMYHQPGATSAPQEASDANAQQQQQQQQQASQDTNVLPNKIETHDYRFVFNSSAVGMAIASMGGAFIDCNRLFCQLSNFTKQEVCSMTIFNLTARQDLQHAFDLISQMLSAPTDPNGSNGATSCVLRGSLKNRADLGLNVALIKGDDGVAKCFCVTLVMNPASPFDTARPRPATVDLVQPAQMVQPQKTDTAALDSTPAYTTG